MPELDIYTTEPLNIWEMEVCDDEYDPRLDDSDKSDELRESREYHPDRE